MRILVIEDDRRISDFVVSGLKQKQFSVVLCESSEEALEHPLLATFDLMIVDVMLPRIDGIQLVQTLRYKKNSTPIIVLSALNSVSDKVMALNSGADDYLTKPFHFEELVARINALTRRIQIHATEPEKEILDFGRLKIDMSQYLVSVDDENIELSPKEFNLLKFLTENSHRAVTRHEILNAVWGINFDNQTNIVDVYVSYLRNKIEKDDLKWIHTVKGIGYLFRN